MAVPPPAAELADRIRGGVNAWIAQTYVQLKRRGWNVTLGPEMDRHAINVIHCDDLVAYYRPYRFYVVGVRCDRPPLEICDRVVVQSPVLADEPRVAYIPNWPQPGLIPREHERGDRCETVGFVGRQENLDPCFLSPEFEDALEERGLRFICRSDNWSDFRGIDIYLAIRSFPSAMLETKPPSKLVNAWHAGIPAVLKPEPAFEAIRRKSIDYLAAETMADALQAIDRIRGSVTLRREMIENGRQRAVEFTEDAIASRWMRFFEEYVLRDFGRWRLGGVARMPERFARFRIRRSKQAQRQAEFANRMAAEPVANESFNKAIETACMLSSLYSTPAK